MTKLEMKDIIKEWARTQSAMEAAERKMKKWEEEDKVFRSDLALEKEVAKNEQRKMQAGRRQDN